MRAGGLRQRLVIEKDVGTATDSFGGREQSWETVIECRARAAFKGGREFERARQVTADITLLLVIRFDSRLDINALHAMRIRGLDDSSVFRILYAVDPTHRRREIHIHVNERQST